MERYTHIMQRIAAGETILIDGATGTEIERRGAAMISNAWNSGGALTAPDMLRSVHADYLSVGAQVVISNTFSTSRHVLEDAGMAADFEAVNRRSMELAVAARDASGNPDALAAGGMTALSFTRREISAETMQQNLGDQTAILAAAGADLIMLEMMVDLPNTRIAINAARQTGLPVWCGFSCDRSDSGELQLLRGESLANGLAMATELGVDLVNIMHTQVEDVDDCLDIVAEHWGGPVGVYAHSGKFIQPNWIFNETISIGDYRDYAQHWIERGVQVIGGCCGIGIEHMRALESRLRL